MSGKIVFGIWMVGIMALATALFFAMRPTRSKLSDSDSPLTASAPPPNATPESGDSDGNQQAAADSRQTSVASQDPADGQVHFATDPSNELPVYTIGSFDSIFWGRHGSEQLQRLEGSKLRITATVDMIGDNDLTFLYTPQAYITDFLRIDGFADTDLDNLHKGDSVEIVCEYVGATEKSSDVGPSNSDFWFLFHGLEIHRMDR